jgi:putative transposase
MRVMATWHCRRSMRLRRYDYSAPGAYFVTLCVQGRRCVFGDVVDGAMICNGLGAVVANAWNALPEHYPQVILDAFVVMPNHVHCVIVLTRGNIPKSSARSRHSPPAASTISVAHLAPAFGSGAITNASSATRLN